MSHQALILLIIGGVILFFISLISSVEQKKKQRKARHFSDKSPKPANIHKKERKVHSPRNYDSYIETLPTVKVGQIIDGDTVDVHYNATKTRIRLSAIDCPEDGQEWGDMATYGLIKLIGGKKHVKLQTHGVDKYGRTVGTFYVYVPEKKEWMNVNERMVTLGHAWVMRAYYKHLPIQQQKRLDKLELWAKTKKIGLWKQPNPLPPWLWRQSKSNSQECSLANLSSHTSAF